LGYLDEGEEVLLVEAEPAVEFGRLGTKVTTSEESSFNRGLKALLVRSHAVISGTPTSPVTAAAIRD
jgi:hypothetical protein